MRRLFLGVVFTLLSCAVVAAQVAAAPPLERLIDIDYSIRLPVHECTVPMAVAGLARRYQLKAGIEYLLVDCQRVMHSVRDIPGDGGRVNLRLLTIGEALRKLSELDPRYRWIEHEGMIVLRPLAAWTDPKNVLNYTAGSFSLADVTLAGALDAVRSSITGRPRDTSMFRDGSTEQGARKFSVNAGATSAGSALDAIVLAHGDAFWEVKLGTVRPNEMGPVIWLWSYDGFGMGMSAVAFPK